MTVQVQSTSELREVPRSSVPATSAKDVFIGGHELVAEANQVSVLPDLHGN